ncbi:MAG: hypothetical protein HY293_02590 [Planctomycetes bacterium]|nr:hypothetical protein [Planctomycetota bacterium]
MRRLPTEFLRARLVALYLLSLAAVYGSMVAWRPDLPDAWPRLAWPPFVLGAAALAGAAIHERLASLTDHQVRSRIRSVAGIVYGGALFLVSMGLLVGHREAAEGGVAILQALQPAFLLFAGFGRGHHGTLINAFVLTAASMLAGGPAAAVAATLQGGLLAWFLVADHAARALTEYPVEALPRPAPLLARGAIQALLVAAALAVWFRLFPAAAYAPLRRSGAVADIPADRVAGLLGNLLFVAVASAVAVYLVLRLGDGVRNAAAEAPVIAIVQARRRSLKSEGSPFAVAAPSPKEWRARIVQLYVRTTQQLAKGGRRRRSFQTALE